MEFAKKLPQTNITRKHLVSDMLKRGGIIIGLAILVLSLVACNNKNDDKDDDNSSSLSVIISASVNMFNGSNTITIKDPFLANTRAELVYFLQFLRNGYNLAAAKEEEQYWIPLVGTINYIKNVNLLDFHIGDGISILLENELTNEPIHELTQELTGDISLQVVEEHHSPLTNESGNDIFNFSTNSSGYTVHANANFKIENLVLPTFYKGVAVTEVGSFRDKNTIKSLNFPRYVQSIAGESFRGTYLLSEIVFEDLPHLQELGNGAFLDHGWNKVVLRNLPRLKKITDRAFMKNHSGSTILVDEVLEIILEDLPNLSDIGNYVFSVNLKNKSVVRKISFKNVNPNPTHLNASSFLDESIEASVVNEIHLLDDENITPSWWNNRLTFFGASASFFNNSGVEVININH